MKGLRVVVGLGVTLNIPPWVQEENEEGTRRYTFSSIDKDKSEWVVDVRPDLLRLWKRGRVLDHVIENPAYMEMVSILKSQERNKVIRSLVLCRFESSFQEVAQSRIPLRSVQLPHETIVLDSYEFQFFLTILGVGDYVQMEAMKIDPTGKTL